jgi:precorrin-6Y C5,15-methyltransferase (decarboxylating)
MALDFNNESILRWLSYFSQHSQLDLGTLKILDITRENKNIIPAVQSSRQVMVLTDAGHPDIFYDMWDAGLGGCDIWYNEGSEPSGPIKHDKLQDMIDRGINAPAGMLIINENSRSTYQIGLSNQQFCAGSIRYVGSEVRAVIMSKVQAELRDCILTVGAASIAVEAALVAAEGSLIAVEHNARDCATMEENAKKFGLNNVTVVGSIEETESLPVPTTAFLVASKYLEQEIAALVRRNPSVRILVYTLELQQLSAVPAIFQRHGITMTEAIQVGVSRMDHRGEMSAEPAPWLISGQVQ